MSSLVYLLYRMIFTMTNGRALIGDLKNDQITSTVVEFLMKNFLKQKEQSPIPVCQFNTSSLHEKVKNMKQIQIN